MPNSLSREDVAEIKKVLEDLPDERREKIILAFHSGRLLYLVSLLDSVALFFEKLGVLGRWVNKVLRPFFTGMLFFYLLYLWWTGDGSIDLTKLVK